MRPGNPESIKFLIVDDTPENLVALEALLRRPGLEILQASSGVEALELLLVHEVALAFLDVQMPSLDGFELAELMRGTERTKHVPIIFVTAGANEPHRVFKGYESGAVDFLFKPIEPHVLKSKADVFFDLYRQRKELATSLHLNELFVAILGHDLRSPLSTMITGSGVLETSNLEPEQRRVLERMVRAGRHMSGMLTQMLDVSRARLGNGVVETMSLVDVAELMQRTVEEVTGNHSTRSVLTSTSGDCQVAGDADRLHQVFANLLVNAVTHGLATEPIVVTTVGDDSGVIVRVRNAGTIAPELLPTLFDPFRGGRTMSSRSSGLGLGLYISKQILIGHGGSLEVVSNPAEGGTAFTARIPRRGA